MHTYLFAAKWIEWVIDTLGLKLDQCLLMGVIESDRMYFIFNSLKGL